MGKRYHCMDEPLYARTWLLICVCVCRVLTCQTSSRCRDVTVAAMRHCAERSVDCWLLAPCGFSARLTLARLARTLPSFRCYAIIRDADRYVQCLALLFNDEWPFWDCSIKFCTSYQISHQRKSRDTKCNRQSNGDGRRRAKFRGHFLEVLNSF